MGNMLKNKAKQKKQKDAEILFWTSFLPDGSSLYLCHLPTNVNTTAYGAVQYTKEQHFQYCSKDLHEAEINISSFLYSAVCPSFPYWTSHQTFYSTTEKYGIPKLNNNTWCHKVAGKNAPNLVPSSKYWQHWITWWGVRLKHCSS